MSWIASHGGGDDPRRTVHSRRTLSASLLVLVIATAGCESSVLAPSGTPESPGLSTAATPAPSASPWALDAHVVARIELPYPGDGIPPPDAQTPPNGWVAVTRTDAWVVVGEAGDHLVRIDLGANAVTGVVSAGMPVLPIAGRTGVWLWGPVGVGPSPPSKVLRVDETTLELEAFELAVPATRMVVGEDAIWALASDRLLKLDPENVEEIGSVPTAAWDLTSACGAIWVTDYVDAANSERGLLARVDESTMKIRDPIEVPAGVLFGAAGRCWYRSGIVLSELQGRELADVRIGPTLVVGDAFWTTPTPGWIQRLDPLTGADVGPIWRLDPADTRPNADGISDWRLLSAGGSLWLLNWDRLVRYDISTEEPG